MVEGGLQKALYGRFNEKLVSKHIRLVLGELQSVEILSPRFFALYYW